MKILSIVVISLFLSAKAQALVACEIWFQSSDQTWEVPNPWGGEGNVVFLSPLLCSSSYSL